MPERFENKVVLVTVGGSGIGAAAQRAGLKYQRARCWLTVGMPAHSALEMDLPVGQGSGCICAGVNVRDTQRRPLDLVESHPDRQRPCACDD